MKTIKQIADEQMSAAEVIEYAINKVYNTDYRKTDTTLPEIVIKKY